MKLLIKYPTRNRPEQFLKILSQYYDSAADKENINWLVSYDLDDKKMNPSIIERAKNIVPGIKIVGGYSRNKIDACNRDMRSEKEWDIVVLISDDMEVAQKGWDDIIRKEMQKNYPDTDGVLWFYDGYQERICTFSIMGKKYYDRFGYMYHPSYKSLWCDNEFTDVAKNLGKLKYIPNPIVKHQHPAWGGGVKMDDLYRINESFYNEDAENYRKRKALNFA